MNRNIVKKHPNPEGVELWLTRLNSSNPGLKHAFILDSFPLVPWLCRGTKKSKV